MGAYSTLWDITGPYRTLEDLTGPYGTILDHKGPKGTFGDHTGPYGTICITSHCKIMQLQTFWLLTDLLTYSHMRFLEGHAPLKTDYLVTSIKRVGRYLAEITIP